MTRLQIMKFILTLLKSHSDYLVVVSTVGAMTSVWVSSVMAVVSVVTSASVSGVTVSSVSVGVVSVVSVVWVVSLSSDSEGSAGNSVTLGGSRGGSNLLGIVVDIDLSLGVDGIHLPFTSPATKRGDKM